MGLSKSERLKILLSNGYFPSELPPPFTTSDFAKYRRSISRNWPTSHPPSSSPGVFNSPRVGYKRRRLSIVNPVSQFFLSKLIADEWVSIWKFINSSVSSLDQPALTGGIERAIPKPDFARIELKKLENAAEYDHILYSDISRFYGTIYTHIVPWALHGKSWSKANLHSASFTASLGNQLDICVRKGQENQTIGIPIGPDTSRIVSEIVAVAIERRFAELSSNDMTSVFRYVDDWFIGFNTSTQSEEAISHLSRACTDFELELNIEKTSIVNAKDPLISLWPEELHKLSAIRHGKYEARDVQHYFAKSFHLAEQLPETNVLDYALKLSRSFSVSDKNYTLFESYILKAARASKISLPIVTQLLINYSRKGAPTNFPRVEKLVRDIVVESMPHGHTSEVAWALFLARELNISLEQSVFDAIVESDNSACALLSLDLNNRGLVQGSIDTSYWNSLLIGTSLWSSSWLLAYEADLKGWLPGAGHPNHVAADNWFKVLKERNISFYDPKRTVPSFEDSRRLQIAKWRRRTAFQNTLFSFLAIARSI